MQLFPLNIANVRAWCERSQVPYLFNEKLGQVAIARPGHKDWLVRIIPQPDRGMVSFGLSLPFRIPEERWSEFTTAVNLANSATYMGAWVLNRKSGEAYFRVTVPGGPVGYSDESINFLLRAVLGTVEALGEALQSVALDGAGAEEALGPRIRG